MLHGTPCAVTTARSTPKYAAAHSFSTKCPPANSSPLASSIAAMRHSHGPRLSSQSWRLPSHRSISPACALRSRRRRCFGGRRRRTAGTPPARSTRRTVRTETRIGGCSSASFSVKCASLKSRYFVRRKRRSRFRTAARSLFTGTYPALPCRSPARPARSTARRTRRTCRTESWSTRAASYSVSFPAPNRATASHRFHCHSAISSILLHGREGGQNRWPLEGGQNRCPSTQLCAEFDGHPSVVTRWRVMTTGLAEPKEMVAAGTAVQRLKRLRHRQVLLARPPAHVRQAVRRLARSTRDGRLGGVMRPGAPEVVVPILGAAAGPPRPASRRRRRPDPYPRSRGQSARVRRYSASVSPDPPNSFGKSLNFGSPSRTAITFSP